MNIMFKPRYHDRIRAGTKITTIRPPRREIKIGTNLSLRGWSGAAYRSPQMVVAEAVCTRFATITMLRTVVMVSDREDTIMSLAHLNSFAFSDGFDSWADMVAAFETMHGPGVFPFRGVLIGWELKNKGASRE